MSQVKCSRCSQIGHKKNSPSCPLKEVAPEPEPAQEPIVVRWSKEMEQRLVEFVDNSGIEPKWEEIALEFDKTEEACKNRYRSLISAEEELASKLNRVKDDEIMSILLKHQSKCEECSRILYCALREWRGVMKCEKCYSQHSQEIDEIWKKIDEYGVEMQRNFCVFCNIPKSRDSTFHFDHINMFNKGDSICLMVKRGDSIEKIKEEIGKCQLVCESCHHLITLMENTYGFTRLKSKITKDFKKDLISESEAVEKTKKNYSIYTNNFENKIYDLIGTIARQ